VTTLAAALLAELDAEALDQLADLLAPRIASRLEQPDNGWLDVAAAAEVLSCPPSRLYALVSARRIPFHKDGTRLLFNRHELDQYVLEGGARRP
jgi:excisionase family DNA binding protein